MKSISKTTKVFILALCMMFVLSLSACSGGGTLAKVDNGKIAQSDLDDMAEFLSVINGTVLSQLSDNEQAELKNSLLVTLVENQVIKDNLKGVDVITKDVEARIDEQIEASTGSGDIAKKIEEQGISKKTIKKFFEAQYYKKAFSEKVNQENPVTDDEIKAYYNEHKDDYVTKATDEAEEDQVTSLKDASEGIRAVIEDQHTAAALEQLKAEANVEYETKINPETGEETGE
jgi:hypothetical protein